MTKLNREQEEIENFLSDYIQQVRIMSGLSDTEIKVVMRRMMDESPEWTAQLLDRYRKKVITKMMQGIANNIKTKVGFDKEVRKVA
jgi:hypothetical protein